MEEEEEANVLKAERSHPHGVRSTVYSFDFKKVIPRA
jgi:hypothetical protein